MMVRDEQGSSGLGGPQTVPPGVEAIDPAGKSLADALRVSFRILRGVMYLVVVLFLATGIESIEEQQIGIRKVFGRVTDEVDAGLVWNWPFPIGEIELVNVREQRLEVDDFWMHVRPQDRFLEISKLPVPKGGLRPGLDGALLTGDRNLLHVKLSCNYEIREAIPFARQMVDPVGTQETPMNASKLSEIVHAAVCAATIRAAASRTADSIGRTDPEEFIADVRRQAQQRLDQLLLAETDSLQPVWINAIVLDDRVWPLKARPSYEAAQRASQQAKTITDKAIAEARNILNETAGASCEALVGLPWEDEDKTVLDASAGEDRENFDLIGQYERARDGRDDEAAAALLTRINHVLMSNQTAGQAATLLAEATSYKTQTKESVAARAKRFNMLLPVFEQDPQFMLERLWVEARDEILNSPTVEKYYLPPGQSKTVLRISRDPETTKQLLRARLQADGQ